MLFLAGTPDVLKIDIINIIKTPGVPAKNNANLQKVPVSRNPLSIVKCPQNYICYSSHMYSLQRPYFDLSLTTINVECSECIY